ncbi:MAG: response regulator, partial [Waterburya sp.]
RLWLIYFRGLKIYLLRVNQVKIFWSYLCLLKVVFFLHFNLNFAKSCRVGIQKTQEYLPDVVICDVGMPELNGNQVLITLRQNFTTATIPFIFLTAITDESQRYQAIQLGANDYLTKPCTIEKLLEAIAKLSKSS